MSFESATFGTHPWSVSKKWKLPFAKALPETKSVPKQRNMLLPMMMHNNLQQKTTATETLS